MTKKENNNHPLFSQWTIGQKSADILAKWMGSWTFMIIFAFILVLWITFNVYAWISQWDPYPFILLNLFLSMLAAIQAPIILMSQNREAQIDRLKADYDYSTNRRSERKIEKLQQQLSRIERKIK